MKNKLLPILSLTLLFTFSIRAQTVSDEPADDAENAPEISIENEAPMPETEQNAVYLNYQIFQMIGFDMSYDQVRAMIGAEGNLTSHSKSGDFEAKSYEWKGDKFARVSVRFLNGKLISKSQSSLTDNQGTADLTQEKFNLIETGMSYAMIVGIIGSDGELTTTSQYDNSESVSYTWKGPNYERIYTSFMNGKLSNKSQSNLK
jgi:hypothetical protein